jgi:hypothetical protein
LKTSVAERRRGRGEREPGEGAGSRASGGRGKLTGGVRPSAAPGEGERGVGKGRDGGLGQALGRFTRGGKKRKKGEEGISWAWAGGPPGVLVISI